MKKIAAFCCLLLASFGAQADIYKCTDESGHQAFVDENAKPAYKQCTLIMRGGTSSSAGSRPPAAAQPASKARTPTPAGFPKVDQNTQRQRDDKRRQILEDELAGERKALDEAKKNYADGEANPETFKGKDGKTYRNVAKFEEKMQKLREQVSQHEQNIQMLEKELGNLK